MDNEIKIFEKEEFGRIRTILINGEPWFTGIDIANCLGYVKPNKAISDNIVKEDIMKLNKNEIQRYLESTIENFGEIPNRGMIFINESGLYTLIMKSKLKGVEKFQRWVTSEVLPSIRKTGSYGNVDPFNMNRVDFANYAINLGNQIINAEKERERALELKEEQRKEMDKAQYLHEENSNTTIKYNDKVIQRFYSCNSTIKDYADYKEMEVDELVNYLSDINILKIKLDDNGDRKVLPTKHAIKNNYIIGERNENNKLRIMITPELKLLLQEEI